MGVTDDVKKAAEEYAKDRWSFSQDDTSYNEGCSVDDFLAGDAHGFARAVKMLRTRQFPYDGAAVMKNRAMCAAWLEEQEKGRGRDESI